MLKIVRLILIYLCFLIPFILHLNVNENVYAEQNSELEQVNQTIEDQIQNVDFSFLDNVVYELQEQSKDIFQTNSFKDKIQYIINGDLDFNFNSIINTVIKLLLDNILGVLPIASLIIAISVLLALLTNFKSKSDTSVKDIVHFLIYGVIIIIISTLITSCIGFVSQSLNSVKAQMQGVFPIILTLLTGIGATSSVTVFEPLLVMLINLIFDLFSFYLIPLFFICLIFTIANNINQNQHFTKFIEFFQSLFKWSIGIIFTIFIFYLSIAGIVATTHDGLSIKITKYTVKNTIPYIGSYMSDGVDIFISSSIIIKNAVGVCALVLLFSTIIVPLVKLLVVNLSLKLTGAVLEPITDKRISNFVYSISKCFNMLIACIISCSVMYFMSLGVLISLCSSV